ncbi:endonuclease/exonuclease/phosphatase family protein [Zoogloea sp. LCSB751]|uniref:endonuclease/exonuclease/phosphatase family protein n=1 Tax=Zoogloea sp. LCSB751 TaxID=1965277 RepID=UPI0009A4F611|nr:endonuclease/exonuclease/phosphatase family protein [Zoogloea sp. LCSB751]
MKLLSWNIQWGRGADGEVDLARSIAAIRMLGEFDVLCLQEVAVGFASLQGQAPVDQVAVLAAAFPGYSTHFAAGVDVPDREGGRNLFGNLTLSRLPVGQVLRHSLPRPLDAGVPSMPRVCLEVVVSGPAGSVRVLNTHLEYYSGVQRSAQIDALRSLQAEVREGEESAAALPEGKAADEDSPFRRWPRPLSAIICGDFNCEPGSEAYYRMTLSGQAGPEWVDAWPACYGDIPHLSTVGLNGAEWPDRAYCCDYFFVSTDLVDKLDAVAVNQATAASDHQPIMLNLL